MMLVVPEADGRAALDALAAAGHRAVMVGELVAGEGEVRLV